MKLVDLSADAVVCKRILNLIGDVAVDEAEPEKKQDHQDERKRTRPQ